jgi:hypothetical protein
MKHQAISHDTFDLYNKADNGMILSLEKERFEDTQVVIRRYQGGNQKIPKW